MAQVWKVRLPDGRVLTPGDWSTAVPLYSTVEFYGNGDPTLSAFSYGIGGSVPGSVGPRRADLRDTNLEGEGAVLPENEEMIIYNICVELFSLETGTPPKDNDPTLPDPPDVSIRQMIYCQRAILVTTRIAAVKEYAKAPLGWFPASTGALHYDNGAVVQVNRGYMVGNNGGLSVKDKRQLASPLYIAGGESFSVDLSFPQGTVGIPGFTTVELDDTFSANTMRMRARIFLDGYHRRPVA